MIRRRSGNSIRRSRRRSGGSSSAVSRRGPADRYGSTRDLARDLASARDHFSELTSSGATAVSAVVPAGAGQKAGTRRVAARRDARARGGGPDGPPRRAAARGRRARPVRFTIAPPEKVTFESSFVTSPFAVSPDGHHLVFAGVSTDGTRGLWLHSFDSLVSRPLPGTEGATAPFWSPDGLAVGFFTENHLKRASIAGGDVTTICEARLRRRRHVESRRRDRVRAGDRWRSLPCGGEGRHADTGDRVGSGARRERSPSADVPAGRPSLRVRDYRRRQRGHLRGVTRFTGTRARVARCTRCMASARQTSSFSCGTAPSWPSGSI